MKPGQRHKTFRVEPDRFEPGTWCVKNGWAEVVAKGFDTEAEAQAWIDTEAEAQAWIEARRG